jgi:hypothetical protein
METLSDVVNILQTALGIVRFRSGGELKITLIKADVDLKVLAKRKIGAGLKFEYFVPVEVGIDHAWAATHTLALTLTPRPEAAALGKTRETEDLADSIIDLAAEAKNIQKQATEFELSEFSIELEIGVSSEGKLKVLLGGNMSGEHGHKIRLSFRPR